MRTHAHKFWIKGDDDVVPVCELIFKDILFLTLYDVHTPISILQLLHTNYSTDPPLHPNPTLIKYIGKGWTNKIIILPGPLWSLLPVICHTSIILPWSMDHGPSIFNRFAELIAKHDHPGWPKIPEQFMAVLFLLEMGDVVQEFLQSKSGCLDPLFQEYHHTFFRSKWSSWVFI